jgi:hypothetical protein
LLGQNQPASPPRYGYAVFSPASPFNVQEGSSQLIQPQNAYYQVKWMRADGQPFPSGIYQNGNDLQINGARAEHSGTYYCELYDANGTPTTVPYEIRVQANDRQGLSGGKTHGNRTSPFTDEFTIK